MNLSAYQKLVQHHNEISIDPQWAQGRTIFGGLTAALVLAHIESQIDLHDRDLRTINIHFCGAVEAEMSCEFRHRLLSQGKSVTQVEGQLLQNGQIKTQVIACFAVQRTSAVNIALPAKQFTHQPDQAQKMPFVKGMMPDFIQHFDLRYSSTNMPFSGTKDSLIAGWIRLADSATEVPQQLSDSAILALIDAWPPAILPVMKKQAPTSTITWNIEFVRPRSPLHQHEFFYYECHATQANSGYAHSEGRIFHANGQLLALNRQLVAVYDTLT